MVQMSPTTSSRTPRSRGGYLDDAALVQIEGDNLRAVHNRFGLNTMDEVGWYDFDGDGWDDRFLVTGATWWYASRGMGPWIYLNTSTKRLTELTLGIRDDQTFSGVGQEVTPLHG